MLAYWDAIKLALSGAKGIFWLCFIAIFVFLLYGYMHPKKDTVTVAETPAIEQSIVTPVAENTAQTAVQDQQDQQATQDTHEQVTSKAAKAIAKVKNDVTLTPDQKRIQIGEAQITSLEEQYQDYYGPQTVSISHIPPSVVPIA